ncbi:hypothetical protein BELL_0406g00040 [Botrytis elliptica]|uniref:Zn(2)-C6 fungal-type domain-containing protein n=1 Tax=Botrytis elliptica TaxID=278938 RepID=A0A4Z1JUM4_9HELO|nr:hypothetical protein BELL_0406g00040 [Botrytis elliptica]
MGRPKTCRRRHVKCDEKAPGCDRCENAGYECEGYTQDFRFVNEVSRTLQNVRRTLPATVTGPREESRPIIPRDLNLSAFQDDIYISFLLSKLAPNSIVPNTWMRTQANDSTSPTAKHSLLALSSIYFGRIHHLEDILKQGSRWYCNALRCLSKDLQDSEKAWSLSVLSSASMLQIYEFIAPSSESAWLTHAGGIGRLLELRGPEMHQSHIERHIFECNRANVLWGYWMRGERCFLERPEWKSVPWALEPASKAALSYLEDILYNIPGMIRDARKLQDPELQPTRKNLSHSKLSNNIFEHFSQLSEWRATWEQNNPNSRAEVPTQRHTDSSPPYPTMICFSTLLQANEILLYNATLLLSLKLGFKTIGHPFEDMITHFLPSRNTSRKSLTSLGIALNIRAVATEMCKIIEYCLSLHHDIAPSFLFFLLSVAHLGFEPSSIQAQWLDRIQKQVAEWTGMITGSDNHVSGRSVFELD